MERERKRNCHCVYMKVARLNGSCPILKALKDLYKAITHELRKQEE